MHETTPPRLLNASTPDAPAPDASVADLAQSVRQEAERLFNKERLHCSQAVLLSLCRHFDTGLGEEHAAALMAGFGRGVGNSGCLCGAVSGGVAGIGLLLGSGPSPCPDNVIRRASAELHKRFKAERGSTCCAVLSRKEPGKPRRSFSHCPDHTGMAAQWATEIILKERPSLSPSARPSGQAAPRKKSSPSWLGKLVHWVLP